MSMKREADSGSNIMVVDDKPDNLTLLMEILQEKGHEVRPVTSGKAAIRAAENRAPDLVLLDVNMPGMDGYEVCERFQADERLCDVPVIFLSAQNETIDKIRAFGCGAVDYITKPFYAEEVEVRVKTHIELRHRKHQLEETIQRLNEAEKLKEDLLHMIMHDMRSPLSSILAVLEAIENENPSDMIKQCLRIGTDAAKRLDKMTITMLDIHCLEKGKMPLTIREHDLGGLVKKAARLAGPRALKAGINIVFPDETFPVMCDGGIILRVIENLLDNALKHVPARSAISISIEPAGPGARLLVADEGPGIPEEYTRTVFEKFARVNQGGDLRNYSCGIGLSFCKLAIEAHRGEIGVESIEGKGSTFWFVLPDSPFVFQHSPVPGTCVSGFEARTLNNLLPAK